MIWCLNFFCMVVIDWWSCKTHAYKYFHPFFRCRKRSIIVMHKYLIHIAHSIFVYVFQAKRDPYRFRFPIEMRFVDPNIDHLMYVILQYILQLCSTLSYRYWQFGGQGCAISSLVNDPCCLIYDCLMVPFKVITP